MGDAIAVIRRRWPEVWAAIEHFTGDEVEHVKDTRVPSLQTRGVHLTSVCDRKSEAKVQADRVPVNSAEAWIYGFALGDLQRELLARPTIQKLTVVVIDALTFRKSVELFDPSDWIEDPRVELVLGHKETILRRPFAVAPACIKLAGPESGTITTLLRRELDASGKSGRS